MQTKLRELLKQKGGEVWSIGPSATVYQAVEMMALKHIGALTVLNDAGTLVGVISERDYARKIILEGRSSRDTHVEEIMTRDVVSVPDDLRVGDGMAIMTENRVRHLPVLADGQLIGMISQGDLVKCIIDEQSMTIAHLERYIQG